MRGGPGQQARALVARAGAASCLGAANDWGHTPVVLKHGRWPRLLIGFGLARARCVQAVAALCLDPREQALDYIRKALDAAATNLDGDVENIAGCVDAILANFKDAAPEGWPQLRKLLDIAVESWRTDHGR